MCQFKKKTLIGGFKHLTSGNRNHESLWILATNARWRKYKMKMKQFLSTNNQRANTEDDFA